MSESVKGKFEANFFFRFSNAGQISKKLTSAGVKTNGKQEIKLAAVSYNFFKKVPS